MAVSNIGICQRTINIINCAQEGASKEKNAYLFEHQGHRNKMDSEYLENYVWIYAHASDLDQGVVFWGIWFLCSSNN